MVNKFLNKLVELLKIKEKNSLTDTTHRIVKTLVFFYNYKTVTTDYQYLKIL